MYSIVLRTPFSLAPLFVRLIHAGNEITTPLNFFQLLLHHPSRPHPAHSAPSTHPIHCHPPFQPPPFQPPPTSLHEGHLSLPTGNSPIVVFNERFLYFLCRTRQGCFCHHFELMRVTGPRSRGKYHAEEGEKSGFFF